MHNCYLLFLKKLFAYHFSIVAILIFFSTNIFAQHWAPVFPNEFFDYKTDTSSRIAQVIKVDSIRGNIYFLNKIAKRCCYDSLNYTFDYVINLPGFLQREIVRTDSDFILLNPDSLIIKKNYPLNKSWNYDSHNSISAKTISRLSSLTYNQSDSIESILLSTGDSIILSKNYGILKFPGGNGHYYIQSGLENAHLGNVKLGFDDYFNFNVGDVFQYSGGSYNDNSDIDVGYSNKYTILSKTNLNPGYSYSVRDAAITIIYNQTGILSETSGIGNTTLFYQPDIKDTALYFTYPGQWENAGYGYSIGNLIYDSTEKQIGCYVDTFPGFYPQSGFYNNFGVSPSDNCCSINDTVTGAGPNQGIVSLDYCIMSGLGIVENYINEFEGEGGYIMTGYVKGTDTVNIFPDSDFLAGIKTLSQPKVKWQLAPNPARSYVNLSSSIPIFNSSELEIFNTSGKLESTQTLKPFSRSWQISTLNLSNGLYFLIIKSGNSFERLKLIVIH
jgi:hypothetical protein